MNTKQQRTIAIQELVREAKSHLDQGVNQRSLANVRDALMRLADGQHLFPRNEFPVPGAGEVERNFLVSEEADGSFALYVNSGMTGQTSRPHNHGGSWAVVAAVSGAETHRLYRDEGNGLEMVKEHVVRPGQAIALGPDDIHSIHAESDAPLLHLHLYGLAFHKQGERQVYDPETGEVRSFVLKDLGWIEDAR